MEAPLVDEAALTEVTTSIEPLTTRERLVRFLARLPWGVIGVVGMIVLLGVGAMALLRGARLRCP